MKEASHVPSTTSTATHRRPCISEGEAAGFYGGQLPLTARLVTASQTLVCAQS
jgi:hypothetical protein